MLLVSLIRPKGLVWRRRIRVAWKAITARTGLLAFWRRALPIPLRVAAAVLGGYLLAAGLSALAAEALARVLPPSEAVVLMAMLAFLIYLALLIWAFAERRLFRVVVVLGVGGPLAFAAQWLVGTAA